ncbi:hypothetical protein BK125_18570 [Paenibacillus odorifer]|nr:hypothetical protein BK125_18570 [Paenibacillus odorifer]
MLPRRMTKKKESAPSEELNLNQSIALSNESTQRETDHSFGISPEEFVKSFNEKAQLIQTRLRINNLNTNEGPGKDSFQYQFTETLIISGRIDKNNGNLIDVSLIGGNDGTTETAEDILTAASLLISSTQINVSTGFGDDVIKKLGLFDKGEDLSKIDNSTVVNGIKYYVLALPSIGLSFGASVAK